MKKFKIDKLAIIGTLIIISVLSIYIVLFPEESTTNLDNIRLFITTKWASYFICITIAIFVINLTLAFSKYGNIKLGKSKPEYKMFSWVAMIFCATMGTCILYWGTLEWVYYYMGPPMGLDPQSMAAAQVSLSYSFFHWGIPAWGIYAIGTVPIAYRYHVRKLDGLSLAHGCEGVTGGKAGWNKIINIIFIFGIVSGIVIVFGTGIPMLVNNLHNSIGTPDTFIMQVLMIVFVTFIFTLSSYAGLDKGMKVCSDWTTYLIFVLLAFIFIFGGTQFQIENTIKSFGMMISNFVPMFFDTEPIIKTGFTAEWTVFYWAWWITLAPWLWIFIAKISKGRTIRQVVLTISVAGLLSTVLFFGILSNYGLNLQLSGQFDFVTILQEQSPSAVISAVIMALPLGKIVLFVWFVVGFMLLVTTLDSAVFTLSAASIRNLKNEEIPPNSLKLFWAIAIAAIPICLMFANASLGALKSTIVITAVPVSITLIFCIISLFKWLKEDYGKFSRNEITTMEECPEEDISVETVKEIKDSPDEKDE
ncbi:MAG: BCCT family transporter [Eubacterium sp.]